jgi:hypothetical protein
MAETNYSPVWEVSEDGLLKFAAQFADPRICRIDLPLGPVLAGPRALQ